MRSEAAAPYLGTDQRRVELQRMPYAGQARTRQGQGWKTIAHRAEIVSLDLYLIICLEE